MPLRPLNDNVILEPDPIEFYDEDVNTTEAYKRVFKDGFKTDDGRTVKLEVPDVYEHSVKKISPTGVIVSWGDRCKYKYMPGQRVFYKQFAGAKLIYDSVEYRVLNEWDIIASHE